MQLYLVLDRGSYIGYYYSAETDVYAVAREYIVNVVSPKVKEATHKEDYGFVLHMEDIDLSFILYPFGAPFEAFTARPFEEQASMAEMYMTSLSTPSFAGTEWSHEVH